jgi:ABC-type multidrug transport system fused ATPase/permease subunit
LARVDKVFVVDAGRLMEVGNPKELKDKRGSIYAEMLKKENS